MTDLYSDTNLQPYKNTSMIFEFNKIYNRSEIHDLFGGGIEDTKEVPLK